MCPALCLWAEKKSHCECVGRRRSPKASGVCHTTQEEMKVPKKGPTGPWPRGSSGTPSCGTQQKERPGPVSNRSCRSHLTSKILHRPSGAREKTFANAVSVVPQSSSMPSHPQSSLCSLKHPQVSDFSRKSDSLTSTAALGEGIHCPSSIHTVPALTHRLKQTKTSN